MALLKLSVDGKDAMALMRSEKDVVATRADEANTALVQPLETSRATPMATPVAVLDRALLNRIRREFFARGSAAATRYGVTIDDLLSCLLRARLASTAGPGRVLAFIEDQILAVACARGHPQAWHDAWSKNESSLLRACRTRLDDGDAIVFTRRFWIDLYAGTTSDVPSDLPSVAEFVAVRPFRIWLTDRLLGRLENETRRALAPGATRANIVTRWSIRSVLDLRPAVGHSAHAANGPRRRTRAQQEAAALAWTTRGNMPATCGAAACSPTSWGPMRLRLVD